MIKTRLGAHRYNNRMNRIFAQARANNVKNAPLHLHQVLTRLTEKVERANNIRHSGQRLVAADWAELYALTTEARAVLEQTKEAVEKLRR